MDQESCHSQLNDPRWRLNNLYWITDKTGRRVRFVCNWAQEELLRDLHYQNIILKARQLGFTTFIQIFMLDACVFNSNIRAGTIAHRLEDARTIFRDKIKYPYDNLPDAIKERRSKLSDSAEELLLSNNSSIRVGTSMRSGTLQFLHVSEYGKMCAQYPEKAREVRTGALNAVQAGNIVFIESTAEGKEGDFFDKCETAQAKQRTGATLTPLDFKFHFFPWWRNPEYELDAAGVVIDEPMRRYFEKLETTQGIHLSAAKQAWYVKKAETQLADMKREYPSTPEEAFEAALEGAYYAEQLAQAELQGRVGEFKAQPELPVNTAWDIGVSDSTAIWFFQIAHGKLAIVGYYENSGEGLPFYVGKLNEYRERLGWTYGDHIFPQDTKVKEFGSGRTRVEQLIALGIHPRLTRPHEVADGINACRVTLPVCYFDEAECQQGLSALRAYRKDWDENHGTWKDKPRHDWASHGADAFRYLSMTWRELRPELSVEETRSIERERRNKAIEQMCQPKTLDQLLKEYDEAREEEEAA